MNGVVGIDMQTLDTSEIRALTGGDAIPECLTVGCGYLARIVAGIAEAFANAPAASYAYGKCGM
jgi:hypothetical protein